MVCGILSLRRSGAMTKDENELDVLSTFRYVVAGLAGLFALFSVIHLVIGLFFILALEKLAGGKGLAPAGFDRLALCHRCNCDRQVKA
jgi:hypothetical protein